MSEAVLNSHAPSTRNIETQGKGMLWTAGVQVRKSLEGRGVSSTYLSGPSLPSASHRNECGAWKITVSVGVGVLAPLLVFNTYERH
ncbi:hypothetical protein MUU77_03205 [Pseudoxanthomonas sp. F37]|uniref:hypothetical protein n=1 Tax=Pseudoxanthomonas sp. F37 TaxID=2932492 RepID=UPI001FD149C2|nr:hypothetical protein [Pseudoxanthomonas sp. F37]UOV09329.1 hypothetical protein MUU77_03205 [Pseudoxanthomonas sp. F37]